MQKCGSSTGKMRKFPHANFRNLPVELPHFRTSALLHFRISPVPVFPHANFRNLPVELPHFRTSALLHFRISPVPVFPHEHFYSLALRARHKARHCAARTPTLPNYPFKKFPTPHSKTPGLATGQLTLLANCIISFMISLTVTMFALVETTRPYY